MTDLASRGLRRPVRSLAIALAVLVLAAPAARAQIESSSLHQLYHQAWGLREGAPGTVTGIAQTTDGYLWLATAAGLYRFDGARFERYSPPDGRVFRRIVRVWAFAGDLWIAHDRGCLSTLQHGQLTTYTPADGLPDDLAISVAQDHNGVVWAAGTSGIARLAGSHWETLGAEWNPPPPLREPGARAVFADHAGALWVSGDDQLYVLRQGASRFEAPGIRGRFHALAEGPQGRLWGITRDPRQFMALVDPAGQLIAESGARTSANNFIFDRRGQVWAGGTSLLRGRATVAQPPSRASQYSFEDFTNKDGLTRDDVFAVFEDREANIWVGTGGGLDLFRDTALTPVPLPTGIHAIRMAVAGDAVWIGSQSHPLLKFEHGGVSKTSVSDRVTALYSDPAGPLWAWSRTRLLRGTGRHFTTIPGPAGIEQDEAWSLAMDRSGRLWAVFTTSGAYVYANGSWARPDIPGLPATSGPLRIAISDPVQRVWMGYDDGTVAVLDGEEVQAFGPRDGIGVGRLTAIAAVGQQTWVAGRDGLMVVEGHRAHVIAGLNNQSVGRITGVVRSRDGSLWLNADRGVVRILAADLEHAIDDRAFSPPLRVFDYLDGVVGGATLKPAESAIVAGNGRLWFAGSDQVLSIDPDQTMSLASPPSVHVRSILAGDREFAGSNIRLPVGTTTVQIKYAGLSLTMPDRVRFRYRLDGVDADWREAGAGREANYANLAPRRYTFHVIASSNNGDWTGTAASLAFVVPPAFFQTRAFELALVIGALALVWFAFRMRVRQVAGEMHARVEGRLAERERIARELHDTLLQGLQGLILRFQAVATRMPNDDPNATLMEEALLRADRVLIEGRDRVTDLRASPELPGGLVEALALIGGDLARGTATQFHLAVEGEPRTLHAVARDEVYWIVREALINAFHHAQAPRVETEVTYTATELRVRCRDDGQGIDPAILQGGGRAQHFGVTGMRERAERISARFEIWSRPGAGTEIELRVPAATAYAHAPAAGRAWLRRLAVGGRDA